ncbi:hypothetical protein C8J56DRAFT_1051667 [Mycena floridula]|nr:hypothetical protein C8J56DRAFT_1051667 [Mycena floridula]
MVIAGTRSSPRLATKPSTAPTSSQSILGPEQSLRERHRKSDKHRQGSPASRFGKEQAAMRRKTILENEPYIVPGTVTPNSVQCALCTQTLVLEKRKSSKGESRDYYAANWVKHVKGYGTVKGCLEKKQLKMGDIVPKNSESQRSMFDMLCLGTKDPALEEKIAALARDDEAVKSLLCLASSH